MPKGKNFFRFPGLSQVDVTAKVSEFELDFNEIFVARLVKAGYMKKKDDTDNVIVDRWFQDICRSVVLEYYDQQMADPSKRESEYMRPNVSRVDLGNGRAEIS